MSRGTTSVTGDIKVEKSKMKWDPKTLEIRTHSVEKTLEPLVHQVTTLVNHPKKKGSKLGKSKNAHKLAQDIEDATARLIKTGEEIAQEFPEIREEMLAACKDCRGAGDSMRIAAKEFADDPCSSAKRATMVRAARALLSSVTRLLCVADMADVYRLLASLKLVEKRLKELEKASNTADLLNSFKNLGNDLMDLAKLSGKRQADLKDPHRKDDMAAARATLKESSKMLLSSSKAYVRHPEVDSAKANRDFVMKQMSEAVNAISGATQATGSSGPHPYETPGALATALDDFDSQVSMDPTSYSEKRTRPTLEQRLESIISGAAQLADSISTRDDTRDKIIASCNGVRQALQDLLSEYMNHATGKKKASPGGSLDQALERMCRRTRELRGQVANLACSMSVNPEKVKMVRLAAKRLQNLCPQVINAARTLAARPHSKVARENMDVFKEAWEQQLQVLTEAVDDITGIEDFLATTEAHILEDVNKCVQALQERDPENVDRTAGQIRGRTARLEDVVTAEMENYQQGPYTDNVMRAVMYMRNEVVPHFAQNVERSVNTLAKDPRGEVDEAQFIDASKLRRGGEEVETEDSAAVLFAEAQARAREQAAYEQLKASGKLQFEVRAEGGEDEGGMGVSSIKVNGVEHCPRKPGHNVVVLDPIGDVYAVRNFNTNSGEGPAMGQFLNQLPEDHVVLVATQELTSREQGNNVAAAAPALERLGAEGPFDPGFHGSYAFSGCTGPAPRFYTKAEVRPRYHGPAIVAQLIPTPAAQKGMVRVAIVATGEDDPKGTGRTSIKVNGIERSPMLRGHNIVVLDSDRNFIVAANFDTADPSKGEGVKMAKFLQQLPQERIVLIGTQGTTGTSVNDAKEALYDIGATGNVHPGFHGSWAFVGYTGPEHVKWAKNISQPRYQGPAVIEEMLTSPSAEEEISAMAAAESEYEPVSDYEFEGAVSDYEARSEFDDTEDWEKDKSISKRSARSLMRALPAEEKAKIEQLAEGLKLEKKKLESELTKWDESGNDIIILAKKMCMMMMEMSDFTRGTGPLKTTMDVIDAAKRIAKAGRKMNEKATEIAQKCPDSSSKNDLLAYIQRIALYSHQLTITARVKADVQMISGELVVSGLDSATSLITAAKNLMNAVISTVKASYVANTKHKSGDARGSSLTWRMRAPEKKPLVNLEKDDRVPQLQRAEKVKQESPIQALSEFDTSETKRQPDFY
ncbi:Catenin alpha-2 [Stylophora pistillata]|uniref:Catenin alpha-2 n=1 Tax=Stylophora pistillata TaxID=50429 RepID=A0A2B4RTD9_STYPI|nr:Catenin alpha-2 [Stylophora pistillata]